MFDYTLIHWTTFVVAAILLSLSPEPDMAFILGQVAKGGQRAGFVAMFGIWTGAFIHVVMAAIGLSANREDSKLRTADRLANLISVFCILSWRVFWMTMLNRMAPKAPAKLALTDTEIHLLDHLIKDAGKNRSCTKMLSHYLTNIARLGGYLARASDPPPGNMVMWRGLSRLTDIELRAMIGAGVVGN